MRRIDRLDKYLKFKGITDYRATIDAGLSKGTIGKSRENGRDLSNKSVEKIVEVYSDLNKAWLLSGAGEMLNPSYSKTAIPLINAEESVTAFIGDNNKVNADQTIAMLVAEVAAQRRVTEKVLEQNSELLAMIAANNKK